MGDREHIPQIAILFYEKGIAIGRKKFGGSYLKKNKGYFWGMIETRPFMRCMFGAAECLYLMDEMEESVAILEEMIELNPNDNQGVRDRLMLNLLELGAYDKYKIYAEKYEEDEFAFSIFNKVLFSYKTQDNSEQTRKLLAKAIKQNKHVVPKLLSRKEIDDIPGHYSIGDENEALYYVYYAKDVWLNTEGIMNWLKRTAAKLE